jgi:tetratricopeptide (TPR) repeat protein
MGLTALLFVAMLATRPQGDTPPQLPALPIDSYPSAMRAAVVEAQRSARADRTNADAAGGLGRVLHAWEQWEPAHASYSRAAALAPSVFDWPYLDACVLQRLGRQQEAAMRFRQALAIAPTYLPARVKLAETLLEIDRSDEARDLFEALIREPAAEPVARFGLGRVADQEGRHQEAVAFFERALALYPEWGAAHYALALSLRALGRTDEARREIELHNQYGARWPGLEDRLLAGVSASREDPMSQLRRAEALANAGDMSGAAAANEAVLARDPSLALAHERLVSQYGRLGQWDKAEEHYRAALRIGFNLADVEYDYGVLLAMQSRWDEAASAYRRACAINPLHGQAHNNLGRILERTSGFSAALEEYRRAVDSQPAFRLARFNLGRALIALGRPADAVTELAKLTEPRDSDSPEYLFALAVAHMRAGDRDVGIKWALEARRLATEFAQPQLAASIDRELEHLK